MRHMFQKFRRDESGAVTVDWVILTAVVMAAVLLLTTPLRTGLEGVLTAVSGYMGATSTDLASQGNALE
ncbi:hypothetical protein GFB49_13170 [Epibacterium sp. SM1979]|uniref:Flp pilus assembly protein, pilin Flp n=1 Tax=Tritonibacter litoralis TaxID=2662264 RepID=A0A843YJH7_9RHOB|nr:hypothetical protein [Tritonibacter litoralis]MQQ09412.1 hypothetical protein [Tritonibacter litoralis]